MYWILALEVPLPVYCIYIWRNWTTVHNCLKTGLHFVKSSWNTVHITPQQLLSKICYFCETVNTVHNFPNVFKLFCNWEQYQKMSTIYHISLSNCEYCPQLSKNMFYLLKQSKKLSENTRHRPGQTLCVLKTVNSSQFT